MPCFSFFLVRFILQKLVFGELYAYVLILIRLSRLEILRALMVGSYSLQACVRIKMSCFRELSLMWDQVPVVHP